MKTLVASILIALLALAGGYWLGRHKAAATDGAITTTALPPVRTSRSFARTADPSKAAPGAKYSLAQIEARLQEFANSPWRPDKEWPRMIESILPGDMEQLLSVVEKNPIKTTRDSLRNSLLARWAEDDPERSVNYAQTITDVRLRQTAIATVLRPWGERDPRVAMDYAQALTASRTREAALTAAVQGWAESDAEGAGAWVKQLPEGRLRNQLASSISYLVAAKSPQDALELAQTSPANRGSYSRFRGG